MSDFKVDKKIVAKNTIALYIRMAFTMIISFIAARVTLQQLGVDDYGLNNLVGSVVLFLGFLNTSIGTAIQRFYSIEIGKGVKGQLKKVFQTGLYLHILIAITTVFLLELFAVFFLDRMNIPDDRISAAHIVFQVSIVQFAISILSVPYAAMLRAREYFDKIALLDIIQAILRLGIIYLLIKIDFDKLVTLSYLNFAVTILYTVGLLVLAFKLEEVHGGPTKDKHIMKEIFSFVFMLILSSFATLAKKQGLVMLINLFFGLAINAAYAIALQVSHLVDTFVQNFKQAMVPQMVSSYGAGDQTTMQRFINFGSKITGLMMLFLSIPVIFESQFILELWLGTPPQYSAELVSLVIININISQLTYFHYQGIQATGKITTNQIVLTTLSFSSILLYLAAFKLGAGFYSAMYINFAISGMIVVNGLLFSHRLYQYDVLEFVKSVLLPLLFITGATIVVLLLLCNFLSASILRVFIVLITSTSILLGLSWIMLFSKSERDKIIGMVKKGK